MWGLLASFALKFFTGSTLSFAGNIVSQLSNAQVAMLKAKTDRDAKEAADVIDAEKTRVGAQRDVIMAGMQHPIWWWGWGLFVFPAGLYAALIHLKSLACTFYSPACEWNILRIPATTEAWDQLVVLSFFGLAATSTVVGVIASKIGK